MLLHYVDFYHKKSRLNMSIYFITCTEILNNANLVLFRTNLRESVCNICMPTYLGHNYKRCGCFLLRCQATMKAVNSKQAIHLTNKKVYFRFTPYVYFRRIDAEDAEHHFIENSFLFIVNLIAPVSTHRQAHLISFTA